MNFDETLGKRLFGDMLPDQFLERFSDEVEDPAEIVPLKIETLHVNKRDTEGLCTYIHIPGGLVIIEDWKGRYSLYETAERTAQRKHLSDWASFVRGTWVSGPPTKAGLYPVRTKQGFRGKDREVIEYQEELRDISGGFVSAHKVTEWVGDWWSDPYPPLPGAK